MFFISITDIVELALYINNNHNFFRIIINLKDIAATYDIIIVIIIGGDYMKVRRITMLVLFLTIILYFALIILKHQSFILKQVKYEYIYFYYIQDIIPFVCFLIGLVYFLTVKNKYTVRHRNKLLSLVLFLILIVEILMVDAHFKPLIGHNPFVSIMPMLDISLRDFLFSHNYLDAFNIILGYFTAKSF